LLVVCRGPIPTFTLYQQTTHHKQQTMLHLWR
jgi:hypothetical protein